MTAPDPARALFTLSMVTGIVMVVAGLLKLGTVLRFVSNAVMVGFINAVGVNIVLGQLSNLTGYDAQGPGRLTRALDTVLHPGRLDGQSLVIGLATIGLIVLLERTRLGALGLVVALIATSAAAKGLGWHVATVQDLGATLGEPSPPAAPRLDGSCLSLLFPAMSLALVGLIQGAGISANFPNDDGSYPDASRDFIGQGVANIASGIFEGMPVGGSVSASSLNKAAGARTRHSLIFAGVVMAVIVVAFGDLLDRAGDAGARGSVDRRRLPHDRAGRHGVGVADRDRAEDRAGHDIHADDRRAVAVRGARGVGLSIVLYLVGQSNRVTIKRRSFTDDGHVEEGQPPTTLPANDVLILQPYGSLFFAAAPIFEAALPNPTTGSRQLCRDLALAGTKRPRLDLYRRPSPVRGTSQGCRVEACRRVRERAARRSTSCDRIRRLPRRGERLSIDANGSGLPSNARIETRSRGSKPTKREAPMIHECPTSLHPRRGASDFAASFESRRTSDCSTLSWR